MALSPRVRNRADLLVLASLIAAGLLGCGGGASVTPVPPNDASPTPREAPAGPPTGPAFVVYTARHTLVVPIATGAPIAQGRGIWVLDDASTPPGVQAFLGDVPEGLPPCEDLDTQTACEALPLPLEGGPICTCVRDEPTLGEVIGVRFHRDARALLTALKDGAPRAVPL